MKPGIYNGMPAEQYHATAGVSKSGLDQFSRSPAHYHEWLRAPATEPTAAMRIGTLAHLAILEPARAAQEILVAPVVDKRTKEGKMIWEQWSQEHAGAQVVTADEMDMLNGMRQSVRSHHTAKMLLAEGTPEVSVWAKHEPSGLLVKGRMDWVAPSCIVDIKTTADASPSEFAKSIANFRYDLQATHYQELLRSHGMGVLPFYFIAVEKTPPYATAVYQLDQTDLTDAWNLRERLLGSMSSCQEFDTWPSYSRFIETISLPKWAKIKPE